MIGRKLPINPSPRYIPLHSGSVGRSNPFETAKVELKDIKPTEIKPILCNFGSIIPNYNNRCIDAKTGDKTFKIASILPVQVTQYIDTILEDNVFYEILFERVNNQGKIDKMSFRGQLKEISSKIQKMGFVSHPQYFNTALVNIVEMLINNPEAGKTEYGIFRPGIFWDNENKKLRINQIEYNTPTSSDIKSALESIERMINQDFKGDVFTDEGNGIKVRTFEDLRNILISLLKWSLGSPLTFASKQRFGANAMKEFQTPLLLGDPDTLKTSLLEAVLCIWKNISGENVLPSGEMDTEKQLSRTMESTTLPCVGDEAGHIMSQESLVTMLKTATTSLVSRTRDNDGAAEKSLALRVPALTTNIAASTLNKTGLNRFHLIVITYSMSFYKQLTKEEKRAYKESKMEFPDQFEPIAHYLLNYWSELSEEESKKLMIGNVDEIGTALLKELYNYAGLKMPSMFYNFYNESDDLVENPELIDKEYIKDAMKNNLFKYIKQLQSEDYRDFGTYSEKDKINYAIKKASWIIPNKNYVFLISSVSRISQMQGKFTHKQIAEKLGYNITKVPKTLDYGGSKAIKIPIEDFYKLVV